MIKKAIALSLLLNLPVFACEVTLPQQLIVLGTNGGSPVQSIGCSDHLMKDLQEIVINVEGKITSFQIQEMLNQKGHIQVSVKPHLVHVNQLSTLIREQLQLPNGVQVKSTYVDHGPSVLGLASGDRVEIDCPSCLYGISQPLKLNISGFDGNNTTVMARVDFRKMVRAFRVIAPVSSFSEISPEEVLKEEYVEPIPQTDLVTDLEKIKFYKTNKPIKAGELLKHSDLNAVNLVRAGVKTEVVLENAMVRIKTHGISRGNGTLGDLVEIFHQQKNKKYLGKVIDHNKVLVEL